MWSMNYENDSGFEPSCDASKEKSSLHVSPSPPSNIYLEFTVYSLHV